jgi:outer membrane protein assembly factor BamB
VKNQGVVALDASTGKVRWESPAGGNGMAPVLVGATLFVAAYGSGSWRYTALNVSDGKQLWTTPITEGITFPSALTVAP